MSVNDTLTTVLAEINPSRIPAQQKRAMDQFRQEVAQLIQQRFPLHHERVGEPRTMGSKQKGTDIATHYDLDLIVPFRYGYQRSAKGMKAALYHALQERYHARGVKVRDQRVSVGLRKHNLAIDVVPGMEKATGSYQDTGADEERKFLILYDRTSNTDRTTNIHRQVRLIKQNMQHYRDVVRLLKAWRHRNRHPISSYAIELLVYQAASTKGAPKTGSTRTLLGFTLEHAADFLKKKGDLVDLGAGYAWPDYLKSGAKVQLGALWTQLRKQLEQHSSTDLRGQFLK